MNETIYITTTIPYVNARPHVGFALELVQADVLARYHRLAGRDVRFQTGTDDNALSNVLSARAAGVPVDQLVATNSAAFERLAAALDVSADRFVRTTEPAHHEAVRRFLRCLRADDTYESTYRGLYCPRCEDFFLAGDVRDGRCPDHGTPLEELEERNHFFRLTRYGAELRSLISSRRLEIVPASREAEVLRFIDGGLRDFSISRSAARADGWGIPFPDDPGQVVYVWVDALINYLTGLGYPDESRLRRFWTPDARKLHVIGKNVWKFHAVYWPALLLSAGLPLPDRIFAHGFLTEAGRKISKSAGTATDPEEFVSLRGVDALRYYLIAHTRPYEDTDFSAERLVAVYDADLADTFGNLFSRLTALCERAGVAGVGGSVPAPPAGHAEHLESFRFDLAARSLLAELARLNREIAEERPWEAVGSEREQVVRAKLEEWAVQFFATAYWLQPIIPGSATRVVKALSAPLIRRSDPLFPKRVDP